MLSPADFWHAVKTPGKAVNVPWQHLPLAGEVNEQWQAKMPKEMKRNIYLTKRERNHTEKCFV